MADDHIPCPFVFYFTPLFVTEPVRGNIMQLGSLTFAPILRTFTSFPLLEPWQAE